MAFHRIVETVAVSLMALTGTTASYTGQCKAIPGTSSWPSQGNWQSLNHTLGGRLLKPIPPASVCHPNWPNYNAASCLAIQPKLTDGDFYADDPISGDFPNWNNDSCLPSPQAPCSGEGFPIYVVNASCPQHVAAGVNFAREKNVRLNVKGSGHDYLGRSTAPNSLSIWTRYIRGISFTNTFKPQGCKSCASVPAVTLGAGEEWGDVYAAARDHNVTFVGGTGDSIGLGGYLTGGGHSPLSQVYGLAADQILEIQVVTPSGQIVTANQVQNTDLFWALRGGGGATFGVMTRITIKTFPDLPVSALSLTIGSATLGADAWWDTVAYLVSSIPKLQDNGIATMYSYIVPSYLYNGSYVSAFTGSLMMPNGTTESILNATSFIQDYINKNHPLQLVVLESPTAYSGVYDYYQLIRNTAPVGNEQIVGSRLLDAKAIQDVAVLKDALKKSTPTTGGNLNMVSGPGTWHAKPAGGSDSVNPAWRSAYAHYVVGSSWTPLNETEKAMVASDLTHKYVAGLRELAPNTGCYVNEADVNEPNFQQAFWGSNYGRLLSIKKKIDPQNVFWCAVCVGSEGWKLEGNNLCRVS